MPAEPFGPRNLSDHFSADANPRLSDSKPGELSGPIREGAAAANRPQPAMKQWVEEHCPRLYTLACAAKYQAVLEYRLIRRVGLRRLVGRFTAGSAGWQTGLPLQQPLRFELPSLSCGSLQELLAYLEATGVPFSEGGHVVYLPPASTRQTAFRTVMQYYPSGAGLKIVKNKGGIDDRSYVRTGNGQVSKLQRKITHSHRHLSLVANLLFSEGIGPRLFDLIEIQCGSHLWTAYVTEHVDGHEPSAEECAAGVRRIRELEQSGVVRAIIPDGYEDEEFRCPGCGGNALTDAGGHFQYIDFQNFLLEAYERRLARAAVQAVAATHFGDRSLIRGGRYLYQSVPFVRTPGKRDPERRMAALQALMAPAGISVRHRLVLDIGCNIGMMMAQYLKHGARWCHGWDQGSTAEHAAELLMALGCTRFSVTGADLCSDRCLEADLPEFLKPMLDGCVISYLAVRGHLGWLESLAKIPWGALLYEGHEGETRGDMEAHLAALGRLTPFKVARVAECEDGDSERRPLALLTRP